VLKRAGIPSEVLPVGQVKALDAYGAVVLGSAVYINRWRKEATRFVKANEKQLSRVPVWIFSSGPTGKGDPVELTEGWRLPKSLEPVIARIKPREIVVLHGGIDPARMKPVERWMIEKIGATTEDSRDWESIETWARAIASAFASGSGT
jgi:menaquinone-dependent protoporphyrinogen oxidase